MLWRQTPLVVGSLWLILHVQVAALAACEEKHSRFSHCQIYTLITSRLLLDVTLP